MPDFRLQLTVPDPVPENIGRSTFYWSLSDPGTFESTYQLRASGVRPQSGGLGPRLGGFGPVMEPNIDFVRIAAAVFTADRSTPRTGRGSNWNSRDIGLTVPVNLPDRWSSVSDNLGSLLGLLTGDSWRIDFVPDLGSKESIAKVVPGAERVVLVSGGADSAIGALKSRQTLSSGGHILVSHVGTTYLAPVQRGVVSSLNGLVPGPPQKHLQINFRRKSCQVNGAKFQNEFSSRSRSLLFLAFGLAVASCDGIPLWIPENGFTSLNPPLGPERRGSLSTRSTHPAFLEGITAVLKEVGAQCTIVNPFAGQTKGEMFSAVAEQFGTSEASEFLSLTHSCGLTGQRSFGVSVRTQCGVCFGCVLRKASFLASEIEDRTDYIVAAPGSRIEAWLRSKSIESSVKAFLRRGIRARDIAVMGLPASYSSRDALNLCKRGLVELESLYS